MTSAAGVVAAVIMLLAIPLTIASQVLGAWAPGIVIHVALGASCLALAIAVFDFALPQWVNRAGAASAAALGAIFLLQAVSLAMNDALDVIAFQLLGQLPERVLPIAVLLWFAGLLRYASRDRTRRIGWAIVPAAIVLTAAMNLAPLIGTDMSYLKLAAVVAFAWFLFESAKPAPDTLARRDPRGAERAAGAASS